MTAHTNQSIANRVTISRKMLVAGEWQKATWDSVPTSDFRKKERSRKPLRVHP